MTRVVASLLLALAAPAWALDFVSTMRPAILYDAPSSAAVKVGIVSSDYPLEKVVSTSGWIKVRDETGKLSWVEESALGSKHTLLVNVPVAQIMEKPAENSPVRARVSRGVVLEIQQAAEAGWVKVRHANGQEGYIKLQEVWGL